MNAADQHQGCPPSAGCGPRHRSLVASRRAVFATSAVLATSAVALLACAPAPRRIEKPQPVTPVFEASDASEASEASTPPVLPTKQPTVPEPADPPPVPRALPGLEGFYAKLDRVRAERSVGPLRVLWLGDSHTAADFMTHQLRVRLGELARDGGPGFVRLGMDSYRHDAAVVERSGKWRKEPILPAQRTRVLDGVFGYGGIRTIPLPSGSATVSARGGKAETRLRISLSYRLPQGAALRIRAGSVDRLLRSSDPVLWPGPRAAPSRQTVQGSSSGAGALDVPASPTPAQAQVETVHPGTRDEVTDAHVAIALTSSAGIREAVFEVPGDAELELRHVAGKPEIFGVFMETTTPGVVLDTVGINGARVATPLAWEPDQFESQVARRRPDLVVLAFGTNEAFDRTDPARYREQTTELLARLRAAVPAIPCWIVGPPDASDGRGGSRSRISDITEQQRRAAEDAGCAFSSSQQLMGGEGSFSRWQTESPVLARGDGVHLTVSGYRKLGEQLALSLLPREVVESAPSTRPINAQLGSASRSGRHRSGP